MKATEASRTAMFMALFRALESRRAQKSRLFTDQYAKLYLSPSLRLILGISAIPIVRGAVNQLIDRRWPGARTSGIARTRLIDDTLDRELATGVAQIVFLGAGFDSRPYRMPRMSKATVFEVDHPATSAAKLRQTERAMGSVPNNVRFVRMDFNQQKLETVLENAGFDFAVRTVFIWEGVSNYLTAQGVDSILLFCAKAAAGSCIVFTYIDKKVLDDPGAFYGTDQIVKLLSGVGEKWTFGIQPDSLGAYLAERGLSLEMNMGAAEYRKRYFGDDSHKMKGYEFYRVAVAAVR